MAPNSTVLIAICDALDIRPDYLFDESKIKIGELSFRKFEQFPAKWQLQIRETTIDFLRRYLELESLLNINYKKQILENQFPANSKDEIEEAAIKLRRQWNLGSGPIGNVIELLEDKGVKVHMASDRKNFDGLSTWATKKWPVIVLNKSKPTDRIRFTALHELGHLVLRIRSKDKKMIERACNHFAGAMLMPRDAVFFELGEKRRNINFREFGLIKLQYGISMQSQIMRCRSLSIINTHMYNSFFQEFRDRGWMDEEPREFDFPAKEESNRMLQLAIRGVSEGVITQNKAAALLNLKLSEFRKSLSSFR